MSTLLRPLALAFLLVAAPPVRGQDAFILRSENGANSLRLRGLVQVDSVFFHGDALLPGTDTTLVRRARPIVEATVGRIFDFRLTPDFGQGKTVLFDAYVEARFHPLLRVRAGKFRPPVGLERLQSAADTTFITRAAPTLLVPNRDVGVQVHGTVGDDVLTWAIMGSNGTPDGGSVDADTNDGKDLSARVFAHPFRGHGPPALEGLGVGIAGTRGSALGTAPSPGTPVFRSPGDLTFFSLRSDGSEAGSAVVDGRRTRWVPQAYWYAGRFGAMAEYVSSTFDVRLATQTARLTNRAWQVACTVLLTDDRASYRGMAPKRPFEIGASGKGAVALAVRYSRLDVDDLSFPVFADPARSARRGIESAIGVSWWMTGNVRVMLNYDRTAFDGGAPGGGDRETETVVLTRFQISF